MIVLSCIDYWPVFFGKIPIPADLIIQFPPWHAWQVGQKLPYRHAEIGDLITQFYPWRTFAATSIKRGILPLWFPAMLLGTPFVGNSQSAIFYPLNAWYYVLPTPSAWVLSLFVSTSIAGVGMHLFARSLGASRLGSTVAGIAFAFCGFMTVWQNQALGDAAIWLPLIFLGINLLSRQVTSARLAMTALVFAMPFLAGHPETALNIGLAAGAFALYRFVWPPIEPVVNRSRMTYIVALTSAGCLALGLAAAQLLPTLDWLSQISRSLDTSWGARPSAEIVTFLSRDISTNPSSAGIFVPEGEAYVGILTLLAAALAALHRKRRDALFFAVIVVLALQVIYGWGPLYALSQVIPLVRGNKNWRLIVIVSFSLAALASLGVSAVEECANRARVRLRLRWLLLAGPLIGCAYGLASLTSRLSINGTPPWFAGPASTAVLLLSGGLILALALSSRVRGMALVVSLLMIQALDLVSFSHGYIPFESPDMIFPSAPVFDYLQRHDPTHYRVLGLDTTYGPNFETMYGLSTAAGYDQPIRRTDQLLNSWGTAHNSPLTADSLVHTSDRRLDLMNVKFLVATTFNPSASLLETYPDRFTEVFADGAVRVFQNRSVLPRTFLVPAAGRESLPNEAEEFKRLLDPRFDPATSVIVSSPVAPVGDTGVTSGNATDSAVLSSSPDINETRILATVATPSVLVLSQAYYPGWRVDVDDRPAALLRVDYGFLGVDLGAGEHRVRFVFDPPVQRIGLVLSSIALIILVALLAIPFALRRPSRSQ
jgi:hypothetical protein